MSVKTNRSVKTNHKCQDKSQISSVNFFRITSSHQTGIREFERD